MPSGMSVMAAYKAQLYFHVLVLLSLPVGLKKQSVIEKAGNGNFAKMSVQLVEMAWDVHTKPYSFGPLCIVI